jgi:peroxiredoxin
MVSLTTPSGQLGWPAASFDLPGTDGKQHSLGSVRGTHGTVIMFICNHCPYVRAVVDKIVRDMAELAGHGVGSIAIMSNDPTDYPEDSFDHMKTFAARHGFTFPYVIDETQDVARAYGAVCTPDFFGFDRELNLAYRGRLDASGRSSDPAAPRELFDAMLSVAQTGRAPAVQHPSVGCSIKWRRE